MLKTKLKEFRAEKKLSQAALAELIGCTDKYISSLESRKNASLTIEKFAEIAKAMNISEFRIIMTIRNYLGYTCTLH